MAALSSKYCRRTHLQSIGMAALSSNNNNRNAARWPALSSNMQSLLNWLPRLAEPRSFPSLKIYSWHIINIKTASTSQNLNIDKVDVPTAKAKDDLV